MNYQLNNRIFCEVPSPGDCFGDGYTICRTLDLLNCSDCPGLVINNGLLLCDCGDSWNCRLCANDRPFWNVVNDNDEICFQFQQPDKVNGVDPNAPGVNGWGTWANFKVFRCCDDTEILKVTPSAAYVGLFEQTNYKGDSTFTSIQQICFSVGQIIDLGFGDFSSDHCFYFKFYFGNGEEVFEEFCSEPFKLNSCKNSTVLLEGVYPDTVLDCFGYFYGLPVWSVGTPFRYSNKYRVRGSFELNSIEIEKQLVTKYLKAVSSSKCEVYNLKTFGLPEEVTRLISEIYASRDLYVDGLLYQLDGNVEKNNDTGSQWFLESTLKRCDCFPDFSCS